jgi:predicted nucleic acid-binding protein
MILLDTSVLIEYFRKQKKENTFFYHLAGLGEPLAISSITRYEILVGKNPEQEDFWDSLLLSIALIPFGESEATEAANIQKRLLKENKTIGFADIAIGATSKVHQLRLATLNTKHFVRIGNLTLVEK